MISASEWRDDPQSRDDASMPEVPNTVTILGGDPSIVGALGLLLQGAGYDVRLLAHPVDGNLGELLEGSNLVLLAPGFDPGDRAELLSDIKRTPPLAALPVVALTTSLDEAPREEGLAAQVPWPCRTSELIEQIEAVL